MNITPVYNLDGDFVSKEELFQLLRGIDFPVPLAQPAILNEKTGKYFLLTPIDVDTHLPINP